MVCVKRNCNVYYQMGLVFSKSYIHILSDYMYVYFISWLLNLVIKYSKIRLDKIRQFNSVIIYPIVLLKFKSILTLKDIEGGWGEAVALPRRKIHSCHSFLVNIKSKDNAAFRLSVQAEAEILAHTESYRGHAFNGKVYIKVFHPENIMKNEKI